MVKVQFGSGPNKLDGWVNLQESDGDITKPLKFEDNSVDFILIEHCLEHVTPHQGYRFLLEAFRILKPKGVIRVIVPDIQKIFEYCDNGYLALLKEGLKTWWPAAKWKAPVDNPTHRDAVETLIFCHGHKSVYNESLLKTLLETAGFIATYGVYGTSVHKELDKMDSHWKHMGEENCRLESCVVEGLKPSVVVDNRRNYSTLTAPDDFHRATTTPYGGDQYK